MKPEDRGKAFLDDPVQSSVFWKVGFEVVYESPTGSWRLAEQGRQDCLVVW
jgi:hypothetical protein